MRPNFITEPQWQTLLERGAERSSSRGVDLWPVIRLDNPDGIHRWLIASVDPADHDRAFGLIDLGTGMPEMGEMSIAELNNFRGKYGSQVEADPRFRPHRSLAEYTAWARLLGWIFTESPNR